MVDCCIVRYECIRGESEVSVLLQCYTSSPMLIHSLFTLFSLSFHSLHTHCTLTAHSLAIGLGFVARNPVYYKAQRLLGDANTIQKNLVCVSSNVPRAGHTISMSLGGQRRPTREGGASVGSHYSRGQLRRGSDDILSRGHRGESRPWLGFALQVRSQVAGPGVPRPRLRWRWRR
jgi:hypothetical protein